MRIYTIRSTRQKEAIWKYYLKYGWKEVHKKYNISRSTLIRWQECILTADPTDKHPLARHYCISKETVAFVKKLHKKKPEMSIEQLRQEVLKNGQSISETTVWHIVNGR